VYTHGSGIAELVAQFQREKSNHWAAKNGYLTGPLGRKRFRRQVVRKFAAYFNVDKAILTANL
jgi:hypothetical protein